jgi:hypothetical protein
VIADDAELSAELRLFGSGALSLLFGGRRVAGDLDFWCRPVEASDHAARRHELFARVQRCLNAGLRRFVPFDEQWRPVLASQIKVRLSAQARLEVPVVPVALTFDPPRTIVAYPLAEAVGLKLTTLLLQPLSEVGPRDQDVYDVADAITRLGVDADHVVASGRRFMDRGEPAGGETTAHIVRLTRAAYEARRAAGEYDIDWGAAWSIYCGLTRGLPGAEHFAQL